MNRLFALAVFSCWFFFVGCSADSSSAGDMDLVDEVDVIGDGVGDSSDGLSEPDLNSLEFDSETGMALERFLEELTIFWAVPGASLTVRAPHGALHEAVVGKASLQDSIPMTIDARFRVGSNTKMIIAAVLMQLVDEGLLSLEDDLAIYLPDYEKWAGITVENLVAMNSGIPDFLSNQTVAGTMLLDRGAYWTPEEILAEVYKEDLLYEPGGDGIYSDSNTLLLGLIIEKVTDTPLEVVMKERIFDPLGMNRSKLDVDNEVKSKMAHGYINLETIGSTFLYDPALEPLIPAFLNSLPEDWVLDDGALVDGTYLVDPGFTWAAGAVITTSPDLIRFISALFHGDLVSTESLKAMMEVHPMELLGEPSTYGLGLETFETSHGRSYGHGGLNFGYQAGTFYFPDTGWSYSLLVNTMPLPRFEIEETVLGILDDPSTQTETCRPAEGLFVEDDGYYLHARLRSELYPEESDFAIMGIGYALETSPEGTQALSAIRAAATVQLRDAGNRLELDYVFPAGEAARTMQFASVSVGQSALAKLGDDGVLAEDKLNPQDFNTVVVDLDFDDEMTRLTGFCVTAVADWTRPVRFQVCDSAEFKLEVGGHFKGFAAIPLTRDPDKVTQAMQMLGLPVCTCFGEDGESVPCT